jgi:sterol desaturase/sphingolipid hydroxylase (fatty acid hydroxylase superfamily)
LSRLQNHASGLVNDAFKHTGAYMGLFSLEHRKAAYWADFVLYGVLSVFMAAALLWLSPVSQRWWLLCSVGLGLAAWTPLEYVLHRFVLHGLEPFSRWHALHHDRPTALICSPTLLSASLLFGLVFLPIGLLSNRWFAMGFTLGLVLGYQAYALTHHVVHHNEVRRHRRLGGIPNGHWQTWLAQRKRWHALHHHSWPPKNFGVTTDLWDRLLGTGTETNRLALVKNKKPPMYDSEQTLTARFFTTDSWMRGVHRNPALSVPAYPNLDRPSNLPGLFQPMTFWHRRTVVTPLTHFTNERKT